MFDIFKERLKTDMVSMRWPASKKVEDVDLLKKSLFYDENQFDNIKTAYLHIPYCSRICTFCGFMKAPGSENMVRDYLKSVDKELLSFKNNPYVKSGNFKSLFLGGGSPSLIPTDSMNELFGRLKDVLSLDEKSEISVECAIHDLDEEKILAMKNAGVNRISFGVQTFDTVKRRELGRISDEKKVIELIKYTKSIGIVVSVDLLCNLPGQSVEDFEVDLQKAFEIGVEGISAYVLSVMRNTPLKIMIDSSNVSPLPDQTIQLKQSLRAIELSKVNGYRHETITHFSKDLDRNLYGSLRYEGADTLAIGAGAGGNIGDFIYANPMSQGMYEMMSGRINKGLAIGGYEITSDEKPYKQAIGFLNRGLLEMNKLEITDIDEFYRLFGTAISSGLKNDLLFKVTDEFYKMTKAGYIWANNLIHSFALPILKKKGIVS
ncbi:MAG: radical SAM protein [Candidatus Delongbacteria bacterium]|nr:radical SAM protein [Candidatus Delongbacteria bacterium]MBN2833481.1 radical SAM protein [Candidatus Delongbacteria bacterium]